MGGPSTKEKKCGEHLCLCERDCRPPTWSFKRSCQYQGPDDRRHQLHQITRLTVRGRSMAVLARPSMEASTQVVANVRSTTAALVLAKSRPISKSNGVNK